MAGKSQYPCGLQHDQLLKITHTFPRRATLFGDVSLVAEGRAVYAVRNELVDVMEDKTGHRSQTLELIYISGRDKKAVAMRLMQFWAEVEHGCSQIVLPPMDLDPAPGDLDPNWAKEFERLVHSPHNKSLNSDTGDAGAD
jgi:hypothetical protein